MTDARTSELERIIHSQRAMIDELAAAAGFGQGDTYSAKSIINGIRAKERIELGNLGPKQVAVLAFIREEIAAGYPFPSYVAIAHNVGWADERRVLDVLESLTYRGKLKRTVVTSTETNKHGAEVTKRRSKWELVR